MRKPNESVAAYNQRIAAQQSSASGGGAEGFGNWLGNEMQYWGGQAFNGLTAPVDRGPLGPKYTPPEPATPRTDRLDRDERALKPFVREGINPRTGLPWSESPGKSSEPPASTGGRDDTRVIPGSGGQTQTGTNMGKVNLPELDMTGIANFNGPSFPTQPETNRITNGYANTGGVDGTDQAILYAQKNGGLDDLKPGASSDDAILHAQRNGSLDGFKQGGKFAGAPTATEGLSAATADQSGLRYDASKYKGNIGENGPSPMDYAQSGEEMRRRSAFLDSTDSMSGLRAVEAGMGIKYAGGKHYANVDGKATEMDSDGEFSARNIKNQAPGEAQALKDKWVKALANKEADDPQTPSSAQNPTQPSGTATFNEDMKQDIASAGQAVDFMNDNAKDDFSHAGKVKVNPAAYTAKDTGFQNTKATQFYLPK